MRVCWLDAAFAFATICNHPQPFACGHFLVFFWNLLGLKVEQNLPLPLVGVNQQGARPKSTFVLSLMSRVIGLGTIAQAFGFLGEAWVRIEEKFWGV